jgi:hypothetical protein
MDAMINFAPLSRDELRDRCAALSELSNGHLRAAGALMDKGQEQEALPYYRESRRLHRLCKALWLDLNPDTAQPDQFI